MINYTQDTINYETQSGIIRLLKETPMSAVELLNRLNLQYGKHKIRETTISARCNTLIGYGLVVKEETGKYKLV